MSRPSEIPGCCPDNLLSNSEVTMSEIKESRVCKSDDSIRTQEMMKESYVYCYNDTNATQKHKSLIIRYPETIQAKWKNNKSRDGSLIGESVNFERNESSSEYKSNGASDFSRTCRIKLGLVELLEDDIIGQYRINEPNIAEYETEKTVYNCFRPTNKYNNYRSLQIEMNTDSCTSAIPDNVKRTLKYNFDSDVETASFVSESIKLRMADSNVENDVKYQNYDSNSSSLLASTIQNDCNVQMIVEESSSNEIEKPLIRKRRSEMIEAFTFKEIEKILNLKTIPFTSMPSSPVKIGEASFSEVFCCNNLIYKIIAFTQWYTFEAFCKEAFIMDVLKNEKGVCHLVDRFLVKGGYSQPYLDAWDAFSGGDNARPSDTNPEQLFGILVMNDCGCDLEKYVFKTMIEIIDFIGKLIETICRLEETYRFEHRDMHWGNIMIKDGEVYLIDFSFSRLETMKIIYSDLNQQEWLFEGDTNIDMQFEIYIEEKKACKSKWDGYCPKSNMLWMRYVLRKLEKKMEGMEDVKCNKRQFGKIVQKAYDFWCCSDFKRWFEHFRARFD